MKSPTTDNFNNSKIAVVGLGNIYRNDDGIGIYAVNKIRELASNKYICYSEDIINLDEIILELMENAQISDVLFIDAADMGDIPGSHMWIEDANLLERSISSHDAALAVYFQLLTNKEKSVRLLAIQPEDMGFTEGLSPQLKNFLDNDLVSIITNKM